MRFKSAFSASEKCGAKGPAPSCAGDAARKGGPARLKARAVKRPRKTTRRMTILLEKLCGGMKGVAKRAFTDERFLALLLSRYNLILGDNPRRPAPFHEHAHVLPYRPVRTLCPARGAPRGGPRNRPAPRRRPQP